MEPKYRKFYVEWWNIKRSTIYKLVAILVFFSLLGFGGWWLYKNNWLIPDPEASNIPKDAARVISFEGDVRIIRAATRETILITRPTFVSAGDTIQTQADGRAKIQMIDGSVLSIRANSTVVIRDSNSLFGGPNVRVTLDGGQINVRTEDQPENTQNVVEVRESENKINSQTDASFGINQESGGGEIRISRGSVETTVGGEKTVVKENEYAPLDNGKLGRPARQQQKPGCAGSGGRLDSGRALRLLHAQGRPGVQEAGRRYAGPFDQNRRIQSALHQMVYVADSAEGREPEPAHVS